MHACELGVLAREGAGSRERCSEDGGPDEPGDQDEVIFSRGCCPSRRALPPCSISSVRHRRPSCLRLAIDHLRLLLHH